MTNHESHYFPDQDYNSLKKKHDSRNRFVDPLFPITWLRPDEICKRKGIDPPKFTVGGISRFDVNQGALGNCWFMAAQQALAEHAERTKNVELLQKVVLPYHEFDDEGYAGIFGFRFWIDKKWQEVVIDDLLPTTIDGEGKRHPQYCQNHTQANEFWAPLLEKAYAKVHGGYDQLDGGFEKFALKELTGGKVKHYTGKVQVTGYEGKKGSLANNHRVSHLYDIVNKAYMASALMTCGISYKRSDKMEKQLPSGHAYTITKVAQIPEERLICIRNPHGDETEWRGKWSEESKEMKKLSDKERKELGLVKDHDGEFWMSFHDFCDNFDDISICTGPFPPV